MKLCDIVAGWHGREAKLPLPPVLLPYGVTVTVLTMEWLSLLLLMATDTW